MSAGAIVARKKNRRNPVYLTYVKPSIDRSISLFLAISRVVQSRRIAELAGVVRIAGLNFSRVRQR